MTRYARKGGNLRESVEEKVSVNVHVPKDALKNGWNGSYIVPRGTIDDPWGAEVSSMVFLAR